MRIAAGGLLALMVIGCSGDSGYDFNVSIPDSIESLEEATHYVRMVEAERGAYLYESDEIRVTGGVGAAPEFIPPDFAVSIWADDRDEALRIKQELGQEFQEVFYRWDVCKIDIIWEMYADGSPISENPDDDSNHYSGDINPGCEAPAVEDRRK
ncbi:MAG: hypothetical protein AAB092_03485 [Chloroflexota bacterium]